MIPLLYLESLLSPFAVAVSSLFSSKISGTVPERLMLRHWPDISKKPVSVWIHAASVGELLGVYPVINEFINNYSSDEILITCQSPNGLVEVVSRYPNVRAALLPADNYLLYKRLFKKLKLQRLILTETELWPGLIVAANKAGVEVELVNAKISDYSWPKFKKYSRAASKVVSSLETILCQTKVDAERFRELGAKNVKVTGNIKYDFPSRSSCRDLGIKPPIFVAGSVREGEEQAVIEAFELLQSRIDGLKMVFAPRQVEKFRSMYEALRAAGLHVARRSELHTVKEVLLLDTLGELVNFYEIADLAFVGGSMIDQGGHNPLEPAAYGVPVIVGPYHSKVAPVVEELEEVGGLVVVSNAQELASAGLMLIEGRRELEPKIKEVADRHRGATHKTLVELGLSTVKSEAA